MDNEVETFFVLIVLEVLFLRACLKFAENPYIAEKLATLRADSFCRHIAISFRTVTPIVHGKGSIGQNQNQQASRRDQVAFFSRRRY
ncbi:MAG: hypothetical protein HGB15_01900 [Chlorobaculum sp.]|nr:hypothetical protein [Chlorobaculum sp.]